MQPITFKQFLRTYNFRQTYDRDGETVFDTQIIRIHPLWITKRNEQHNWFEFGIYDYDNYYPNTIAEDIFNDKIMNSYVDSFCTNNNGDVEVYLVDAEHLEDYFDEFEWDLPAKDEVIEDELPI